MDTNIKREYFDRIKSSKNDKEILAVMKELYDAGYKEGNNKGYMEGEAEGYETTYSSSYKTGYNCGIENYDFYHSKNS